jgi:phosphoglycolate phosphatase
VTPRPSNKGSVTGLTRPDALVFDLDGTLWDAAEPTTLGWNRALEEMGVASRVTVAGIRAVAGTPFDGCVEILLPELCPPAEDTLRYLDAYEKAAIAESGGTLFPGVADGIRALAAVYPLFLVSNCQDWYLEMFLAKSGLRECFTGWDCNGLSGLPKSGMLLRVAESHRLKQAVYVGDTQGDRDAAREAGMEFALARYGFGGTRAPALSFGSFGELVAHFLSGSLCGLAGRPVSASGGVGSG